MSRTSLSSRYSSVSSVTQPADPYLVSFLPDEPANPLSWSVLKRWYLTVASGVLVLNATFSSSAPSGVLIQLVDRFHLSNIVAILTISLFVAGYCVGPLVWGPLSEQYGRRPIFISAFVFYVAFQIGNAVANNTATILLMRFFGGTFAACPLSNSGGVIADIWDSNTRGKALAIFTVAPFAGPALGPTVAGFITLAGVSWRWLFWVLAIFAGACLLLIILTIPETYPPALLVKKARRLRKETGDSRYYAPLERDGRTFITRLEHILTRPFRMLFYEPMLMACTVYMSFVYGCLYLLFEAYPIVFTEAHHLNAGISGLTYLPLMVGGMAAVTLYVLIWNPQYEREAARLAPHPVPPEFRLKPSAWGAFIYAMSFFWFAWTSYPSISLWAPMMSGLAMGFGISWIFLGLFNYLIDTYLMHAASALAVTTIVRSFFGAGFPLFATQMYERLNPRWASTILGCIALSMMPIPFIFMKYGPALRRRSKYAPSPLGSSTPDKEAGGTST